MLEEVVLGQKLFFSGGDGWDCVSIAGEIYYFSLYNGTHWEVDAAIVDHYGELFSAAFQWWTN